MSLATTLRLSGEGIEQLSLRPLCVQMEAAYCMLLCLEDLGCTGEPQGNKEYMYRKKRPAAQAFTYIIK